MQQVQKIPSPVCVAKTIHFIRKNKKVEGRNRGGLLEVVTEALCLSSKVRLVDVDYRRRAQTNNLPLLSKP